PALPQLQHRALSGLRWLVGRQRHRPERARSVDRGQGRVSLPAHGSQPAVAPRRSRSVGQLAALRDGEQRARLRRHAAAVGAVDLPLLVVLTRRVLLIANPASRRGGRLERAAVDAFHAAGVTCDAARTERPGHAAEIARARGRDYDCVFTLGGDGTAMEVAGALAWSG